VKAEAAAAGRYGEVLRRLMEAVDAVAGAGDGEEGHPQQMSPAQEAVYCRLLASVPLLTPQALTLIESYVASGRRYAHAACRVVSVVCRVSCVVCSSDRTTHAPRVWT
jgi:hypothetical protein